MHSKRSWFVVFNNINVYLHKFEQCLTHKNTMLSLTNTAIIAQPDIDPAALDLQEFWNLRGNRSKAIIKDIIISPEESDYICLAMIAIVTQLIVVYCPGSMSWPDYMSTKKRTADMTPTERSLPVRKTKTFPFGVFDINEGSKCGCVQVTEAIRDKSKLTEEQWKALVYILMEDWLSANNLRAAQHERVDNVNVMEQMSYLKEISVLWHYGLNALLMIIKVHLSNAIDDPGLLASHKGLLGHVWDVNKPNYAAAKSLMHHSLIAWLLNIIM